MKNYDFLIVGAGIFGISTALELRQEGYSVCVLRVLLIKRVAMSNQAEW